MEHHDSNSMVVSALWIYPIKSTRGIAVQSARVSDRGFAYDRRFMVVDTKGNFITQRTEPRLALVEVALLQDGLLLRAPGMQPRTVRYPSADSPCQKVRVWADDCQALPCDNEVNDWFGDYLKTKVMLVYMPDASMRRVDTDYATSGEIVSFADGYPFLLISEASLDDLNARLTHHLPMNRFRPNIIVRGCPAFAEDDLQSFSIGDVVFQAIKPCFRCTVTTVDQATGIAGQEPLVTLATYRKEGSKVRFGQNLVHRGSGIIQVGDTVNLR